MTYYKNIYETLSNKYPNTKVYVISDHHFFHENIIKYANRPFSNVLHMNEFIISSHNRVVSDEDIVLFLGDFSFKKIYTDELLSKMKGHKYLLLGNHDDEEIIRNYKTIGFEGIFINPVKFENNYLSHYPISDRNSMHYQLLLNEFNTNPNGINYHGHIHGNIHEEKCINVSCEALDYTPLFIGYTSSKTLNSKKNLIESIEFNDIVKMLQESKNLNSTVIIADYIYTMMLEKLSEEDDVIVYGSFPQYKKYGFIANFGDLDASIMYDDSISKSKNISKLKQRVDSVYKHLLDIEKIDLNFIKRYVNMCAFLYTFSDGEGTLINGALDMNMIPLDCYKNEDFISVHGTTAIEKMIQGHELTSEYVMPRFETKFLKTNGDISNLILQVLYQNEDLGKQSIALRRIRYICKYFGNTLTNNDSEFENMLSRFFLRNIIFLYTLKRKREIEYIKEQKFDYNKLELFPNSLREIVDEILLNPDSQYNFVKDEISKTHSKDILGKCKSLIKELK